MPTTEQIGKRGELIFETQITAFVDSSGPLFDPVFLGEKHPTADYLVKLYNTSYITAFFFVQVKATDRGYTEREQRLRVALSLEDIRRLQTYPAPTYLVGVDVNINNEVGFLKAITGNENRRIANLPTTFDLTRTNLHFLWEEVYNYWRERDTAFLTSRFQ